MDGFNTTYLDKLLTTILRATQDGLTLDINDADQVGPFVCAIIGLGAGLIPVVGTSLGALCNLIGAVVFAPNSMEKIWDALRERIEQLIDATITEYRMGVLKQWVYGFQSAMRDYHKFLKDFDDASPGEKNAGISLMTCHISFRNDLNNATPQFQNPQFAVASLPLFSLVATMQLALLADGIKRGKDWGYTTQNIDSMRNQFNAKTSPNGQYDRCDDVAALVACLAAAILEGKLTGVLPEIISVWEQVLSALNEQAQAAPNNDDEDLDYITYVHKTYNKGRGTVKPDSRDEGDIEPGAYEAAQYHSLAAYDSSMIMGVLTYAELWPFMTGELHTWDAVKNLDREIFFGPFGRYTNGAAWSPSNPPPVVDRRERITRIYVRAWDDIDGLQVRHGSTLDDFQGNSNERVQKELGFAPGEYVHKVNVGSGQKLELLHFFTTANKDLSNGSQKHVRDI